MTAAAPCPFCAGVAIGELVILHADREALQAFIDLANRQGLRDLAGRRIEVRIFDRDGYAPRHVDLEFVSHWDSVAEAER